MLIMIIRKMFKLFFKTLFFYFFITIHLVANDDFNLWLDEFKLETIEDGTKTSEIAKELYYDLIKTN